MIPQDTSRLSFRCFKSGDLDQVLLLNRDPKVMTYFPGMKTIDEIKLDFKRYLEYHQKYPGYGYWYTSLKDQNVFVGFFVVKILAETGETEIGYRLLPEYWGRGLATEGAKGMVDYVKNTLKISRVVGVVNPENLASRKVLENAGLLFERYGRFYQVHCAYYGKEIL